MIYKIRDIIKIKCINMYQKTLMLWVMLINRFIVPQNINLKGFSEDDIYIYGMCQNKSDISDHLPLIFKESIQLLPKLIVELGVRGGASTLAFERIARHTDAHIISVDLKDCSRITSFKKWHFIMSDDLEFAGKFEEYCQTIGIKPDIDVLFIDTSHIYEHTAREIKIWFPFLAKKCMVLFHDTNLRSIYKRKDGSIGLGWNNKRGVIRALEEYLETNYKEKRVFTDMRKGWHIRHFPWCNGLTILNRG